MIAKFGLSAAAACCALIFAFVPAAEAGKKKLYFGGPLGTFNAQGHGSSQAYQNDSQAKARAAARAKAKARARAAEKAAAKKRAAEQAKAAKDDSEPEDSTTAAAPSTAAVLTRTDISREQEPDTDAAQSDDTTAKPEDDPAVAVADPHSEPAPDAGGCKRFDPTVGMTVSVDC